MLVLVRGVDPAAAETTDAVAGLARTAGSVPGVLGVQGPGLPGTPPSAAATFQARDGRGVAVVVALRPGLDSEAQATAADEVEQRARESLRGLDGATVRVASSPQWCTRSPARSRAICAPVRASRCRSASW
ncbi:hypothetical protein GCM10025868_04090 [Angustibacter aerolatus]|uniref:Membrane transport protein MMPL domain-containing protein n=1 Tax=Angustibacter aerolatus TaxID=1162965 RepID=A0ABQ6JD90_9ACTN|nr:hypothetical protein GCM10025868_04090 [Angustibacter aerolatus]